MRIPLKLKMFAVFHLLMKFLPSILFGCISRSDHYGRGPIFYKAVAVCLAFYAIGSLIWDYFTVKKFIKTEKINIIPLLLVDILLLVCSLSVYFGYLSYAAEVAGCKSVWELIGEYGFFVTYGIYIKKIIL